MNTDAIEQELKLIAMSLTESRIFFQHNKQQLLKERSKILENIKTYREEINAKLDHLEKTTLLDVNMKFDSLLDDSERQLTLLQSSKTKVSSVLKKLDSSNVSMSQKFVNYKRGKQIVHSVGDEVEDISTRKQNITCKFKPCKDIKALLETMTCFGKVKTSFRKDLLLKIT